MDGKGAWRDNVFVERLWRSLKYEEVYLQAYESVSEARASLTKYLDFYNQQHALEPQPEDAGRGLFRHVGDRISRMKFTRGRA